MSHSKTGRKNNWKAVTQQKSIQPCENDSSSYLVCHFPKQRLTLCLCFSVVLLLRYSMHCLTGSSTNICIIYFLHWTQCVIVWCQFLNNLYKCAKFQRNLRGSVENEAKICWFDMEWPWSGIEKWTQNCTDVAFELNQAKWEHLMTMENHCSIMFFI